MQLVVRSFSLQMALVFVLGGILLDPEPDSQMALTVGINLVQLQLVCVNNWQVTAVIETSH